MSFRLNYKKYHWNDLSKLERDIDKLHTYFDIILEKLYKELNVINNENNNKKYWKLLIGPWLFQFIQYYYDKYEISKSFLFKKKKFEHIYPLENFLECYSSYIDDKYIENTLYEINFLKKNNLNLNPGNGDAYKNQIRIKKNKIKFSNFIKDFFFLFKKKKYKKKILNLNLPLTGEELNNLSDSNNKFYKPVINMIDEIEIKNTGINEYRFKSLKSNKNDDDFIRLINKVLIFKIPKAYIEYYDFYKNFYIKYIAKYKCDIVLVRSPLEISNTIRYFISLLYLNYNTKIFAFQEGGIGKFNYQKLYEKQQLIGCDLFFQWSRKKNYDKTKNFYLTKTFWLNNFKIPNNKKILIVMGSFRKHFFSIYEGHLPLYSVVQLRILKKFISSFELSVQKNISIRFHKNFGYGEQDIIDKWFPKINKYTREKQTYFYDFLDKFELKIFTSDYTANMQSILINHPTILLIDKKTLPFNESYKEVYELLIKEKIYFSDAYLCAEHINKIIKSGIKEWWFSESVQKARLSYINNLCVKSENLVEEFKKILD